ncbi:nucleotidyltransferase AbiEii toxin of type IV toxin-antitoxin system [Ureibacillus xyleni]|uniref:Nucleotidyltransferase AbiEii toxin of type IV toxin-antitoxin system n=1 Tax=Ureibacillus xyleni TaxID=614648 RepID=A0A285THK5_9BACL|nr:nucleotidyl transferase AbiEii/AbiGii toxin family protein [Ureibacillus xyleni]SOC21739.1 nucleotidyltransferase AbiEii toxin of type IV toxin-antitoxin system [Ureibacillus xyleni]
MSQLNEELEKLRKLTIIGLFADDDLMNIFVLKGGNALELAYKLHSRASMDIDVSLAQDFEKLGWSVEEVATKIQESMTRTFKDEKYHVFDFKMSHRPNQRLQDIDERWGGYAVEFKVISLAKAKELDMDLEKMRKTSIAVAGTKKTLKVDISKYEFVEPSEETEFEDYVIKVYTPRMIVFEKIRAICQQMPEYKKIMHSSSSPRPRDFYDIYMIITQLDSGIHISSEDNIEMLRNFFEIKKVPFELIKKIQDPTVEDFHASAFSTVEDTVKDKEALQPFAFYYEYVVNLVSPLYDKI